MESNLTKNVSQFMAVGNIKVTSKTFRINQKVSAKWNVSSMALNMTCGDSTFRTFIRGGYNPLDDKVMYAPYGGLLWKMKDGKPDYTDKKFSIKRSESTNEEVLNTIAPSCKLKVKIGEDEKEFVTVYDMIGYLESLEADIFKDRVFRVYGNISYEFTKDGELVENYNPTIITEVYNTTKPVVEYRQSVLVSQSSFSSDNSDTIRVKGFVPEYVMSKGDIEIRSTIALPFEFLIDKKEIPMYGVYLEKFFQSEKGKFSEVSIKYRVNKVGDVRELTFEDINTEDNKDSIELYRMLGKTDEEILEEFSKASRRIVASTSEKTVKYFTGIYTKPVYSENNMKMVFDFTPNKYKESDLYFVEDFHTKKTKAVESKDSSDDMGDLKKLLGL